MATARARLTFSKWTVLKRASLQSTSRSRVIVRSGAARSLESLAGTDSLEQRFGGFVKFIVNEFIFHDWKPSFKVPRFPGYPV